jgi:hypothetical protein
MSEPSEFSSPTASRWGELTLVQRPQQRPEAEHQHRYADQHDQAEHRRRREQDDGDHREGDDRAGEPGGHLQHVADVREVAGADADHLAGGQVLGQGGAEVGGLAGDHLDRAVGGAQPVRHREPVPHDAGPGLQDADGKECDGPEQQAPGVTRGDALVDRLAQDRGHERLRAHPDDAEHHPAQERGLLPAGQPEQVTGW